MTNSGGPERDEQATQQVPIPGRQPAGDSVEETRLDAPPPAAATAPQEVPPEPPAPHPPTQVVPLPQRAQQFYDAPYGAQPQGPPPQYQPQPAPPQAPQPPQPEPPTRFEAPPQPEPPAQLYGAQPYGVQPQGAPQQLYEVPQQREEALGHGAPPQYEAAQQQEPYGAQPQGAPPQYGSPQPEQAPPVDYLVRPSRILAPAENWHRLHYPIGVFLIAYGLTALLASLVGWSAHRKEIAGYLGEGVASPALIAIKVAEVLIVMVTIAGVLRRRDVWFMPALVGWMAGFGLFCVLDVAKGKSGRLVEHAAYLVLFAVLLFLSYAFGVKARVGREAPPPSTKKGSPSKKNLSRTQEIALAALNRWQRASPPS